MGLRNRPKLWVRKKPRVNSPLVSLATKTYQGTAKRTNAATAQPSRRSKSSPGCREHRRYRPITATGNTKPTGPFAKTARAMQTLARMIHFAFSRDGLAERGMLRQKAYKVATLSASKRESG